MRASGLKQTDAISSQGSEKSDGSDGVLGATISGTSMSVASCAFAQPSATKMTTKFCNGVNFFIIEQSLVLDLGFVRSYSSTCSNVKGMAIRKKGGSAEGPVDLLIL